MAFRMMVSPGYFRTLGTPLLAGQDFDPATSADAPLVAVVNQTLVKQFCPSGSALGKDLLLGEQGEARVRIIGVVHDVQQQGLDVANAPEFFLLARQSRPEMAPASFVHLLVRTSLPAEAMAKSVGGAVLEVDREQPVAEFQTLAGIVDAAIAGQRLTSDLVSGFSGIALLLCLLGIYGVVAHAVSLREREIGVRMALGAEPLQVLKAVMVQGVSLALAGIAIGLAVAFPLTAVFRGLLFHVGARDPLQFVGVPLLLALASLIACYLPARRAIRIHPAITLKTE